MPPYVSRSLDLALCSSSSLRRALRVSGARRVLRRQVVYRNVSTSTSTTAGKHNLGLVEQQNELGKTLRRARFVLESVSRLQGKLSSGTETVIEPLAEACDALSVESSGNVGVAVCSEEETPARDLVTVLLDDPLSSDSSLRSTIQERWSSQGRTILRFQQIGSKSTSESSMMLSSPFFSRFSHPVALEELRSSTHSTHILEADVPIIVASPLHSPSPSLLFAISQKKHAILVTDSALDPTSPSAHRLCSQVAEKYQCDPARVVLVDTARALRGASALSADPSSASAVRAFQEDVLASGVTALLQMLTVTVSLGPEILRTNTRVAVVQCTLTAAKEVIRLANEEMREVRSQSSALHEAALEARERAEVEILGGDFDVIVEGEQGRVVKGVERVSADLTPILDGLAWYRLPYVVDDVSVRVDSAVERAFAKEFENELIFHTGRLASLQARFVSRTTSLLSSLPPAFRSPVLQNHLAQITSSHSFPITASSSLPPSSSSLPTSTNPTPALLNPLRTRAAQLAHATRALHLSAQRLVLFTFSSTALSSLSSAILYVHFSIDAATSIGFGALSVLVGLRWAVERWMKARQRWWSLFERVGDGLGRDMSGVLGAVLDRQVCIVPTEACKGLQRLVEKREQEIGEVEDEVEELEACLGVPKENEDGKQ